MKASLFIISIISASILHFIKQTDSGSSNSITQKGPTYQHRYPYRYSQPRQLLVPTPERRTIHNLPLPFHAISSQLGIGSQDQQNGHPLPDHHNPIPGSSWGWETAEKDDSKAKEVIKFINEFLGVMGPFLFPLPYVLALIPFAIPAIPLSLWLESRGEHHRPGGGEPGHNNHPVSNGTQVHHPPAPSTLSPTVPTTPRTTTTTTTRRSSGSSSTSTNVYTTTTPNPTSTFPNFPQTTTTPNNSSGNGGGDSMENSSFTQTSIDNNFTGGGMMGSPPDFNFNPVTLFPFTLFLNSSFLGDDYSNERNN